MCFNSTFKSNLLLMKQFSYSVSELVSIYHIPSSTISFNGIEPTLHSFYKFSSPIKNVSVNK